MDATLASVSDAVARMIGDLSEVKLNDGVTSDRGGSEYLGTIDKAGKNPSDQFHAKQERSGGIYTATRNVSE